MSTTPGTPLLQINELHVSFPRRGFRKEPIKVIRGISLDIAPGETVGLVGESGSGKTTIGRAILGLAPVTSGSITFQGKDLGQMPPKERRRSARDIQVVFQDPYSSLNPAMTIEDILSEPMQGVGRKEGREKVRSLLESVNLPPNAGQRLAREFSGGQRQRIAIARALALSPKLIICDEPTSALDLSTQARVLDLFLEIQERTGVAYLFITHDLAVVRRMSHRIAVLFHGTVAELGTARQITDHPEHPYTQRLLMAAPVANPVEQERRRAERHRLLETQRQQVEQGGGNLDMWVA
ncbi:peptide ABC transporter ATP-binding protein [Arthrobacter sp. ERGS1:01]|uniref:ABC transporter ATP-binding protein n=1 Tax=Arthrobacter sp. ERGS1:01 TaxID=1704044 RepID=UPI0006B440A9|nr:ATP-binding cassette domain-containing protein [Arthrobacter sp. ERGS1:01]ALE05770.1 peptide ABC transporter ATP-binding protein [Arthrobacter sp. ERGS1:01]